MGVAHHYNFLFSTTTWIAIYGAVVATCAALWNVFTWRRSHAFDVRVTVETEGGVTVGSGRYEVIVVARNHGATTEAVQEIWLRYAEHGPQDADVGIPSVRMRMDPQELPPHRNVRKRTNLLGSRFGIVPTEFTAVVLLESGRHVRSKPFRTDPKNIEMAMLGREEPDFS